MGIVIGHAAVDVECADTFMPEFPELRFGTVTDTDGGNVVCFDATGYLEARGSKASIAEFFKSSQRQLEVICSHWEIKPTNISWVNRDGHVLINGDLTLPYLMFAEPGFCLYVYDRIADLFEFGVTASGSMLKKLVERNGSLNPESDGSVSGQSLQ